MEQTQLDGDMGLAIDSLASLYNCVLEADGFGMLCRLLHVTEVKV
jgi:hypothetical protein